MQEKIYNLRKKANWVRNQVLEMISKAGKGHIGGAFSCADILVALYYGGILRFDPSRKDWNERDRFILSKGHSSSVLYTILADLGYFPISHILNYGQSGCMLGGHPDRNIPGVEIDSGSLGHGLGIGAGLALSAKMDRKDFMTVVLLGDGECCEGSVWEAGMFAVCHKLNNLTAIVDRNGLCATDFTDNCVYLGPLEEKWSSFGWDVRTINGHAFEDIISAFKDFRVRKSNKPLAIIANTVKGKGVSFMEGSPNWHHNVPKGAQIEIARKELKWTLENSEAAK